MSEEFIIYDWYGTSAKLKELGYEPIEGNQIEFHPQGKSVFETAEELFKEGLNVMVRRYDVGIVLHTSNGSFEQRG